MLDTLIRIPLECTDIHVPNMGTKSKRVSFLKAGNAEYTDSTLEGNGGK